MRTWAIYLWPRGPSRPIYSDTLFGALCWAWRAVRGPDAVTQLLARAVEAPPFVTSSAFPVLRTSRGVIRTYPTPLIVRSETIFREDPARASDNRRRVRDEDRDRQAIREIERVPYVSEQILASVTAGERLEALRELFSAQTDWERIIGSGVLFRPEELDPMPMALRGQPLFRESDILRNQTDRVRGAAAEGMLFTVPARFYAEGLGLWFALRADALDPFIPCLRYLADTGIGGMRSVGLGQFGIPLEDIHELGLPAAREPSRFMVLSRYAPEPGEILPEDPRGSYRLVPWFPKHEARGAAPGMAVFKGRLLVMREGSVLVPQDPGREFYGRCIAVAGPQKGPDSYPVYHNGATIPVFLPVESEHA